MQLSWFIRVFVTLLLLTACRPNILEKALRGELSPLESNTVITGYCQGCHIHRTFDASEHVQRVQSLYTRPPYTTTAQCRACHLVAEDTWGARHRKTIFPDDVVHNRYAAHERSFLKANPELANSRK